MDQVQARNALAVWQRNIDAMVPQVNPADRHAELLAKYQVRTDSTVLWPTGLTAVLLAARGIEPKEVTQAEATMLDNLQERRGLVGLKEFADLRQDALNTAQRRFPGNGGTDGHGDAFRHAYWNALMTQKYGEPWAAEFATAHERHPDSHHIPVAMDLHNNEEGRKIALANLDKSPEELAVLVEQAVNRGDMVVIDQNDTLRSSNEVPHGQTRLTNPDNAAPAEKPWPEHNPDRADDRDPGPPSAPLKPR